MDDREVERLYGLPREEFLPGRQALSRRLKDAGDREGATAAGGLRKPTVAAWAVNQVARTDPAKLNDLFASGDRLARLQLRGGGAARDELRAAIVERRRLIDTLVQRAERLMAEAGYGPSRSHLDGVAATLEAATADDRTRDVVRRGILDKELPPPVAFGGPELRVVPEPEAAPGRPGRRGSAGRSKDGSAAGKAPRTAAKRANRKEGKPAAATPAPSRRDRERLARARDQASRLGEEADTAESEARRLGQEAAAARRVAVKATAAAERAERRATQARGRAEQAAGRVKG